MKQIFDELLSTPGVVGGFLFHRDRGMIAHTLPEHAELENIERATTMLVKSYMSCQRTQPELFEITMHFEDIVYLVRSDSTIEHFLVVLCDPVEDVSTLASMAIDMILEELQSPINGNNSEEQEIEELTRATAKELMRGGPVAESLNTIHRELVTLMGSKASIIFQDALSRWIRSSPPDTSSLPQLVEYICGELSSNRAKQQFTQTMVGVVSPSQLRR